MAGLLRALRRSERGAVLVEFALTLPLLLVLFAIIIEGGRLMWSYQSAVAGVRDAARHVGRVVSTDICVSGAALSSFVDAAALSAALDARLPAQMEMSPDATSGVTVQLSCVAGSFRVSPAPVVTLTARVRIAYPFEGLFSLAGRGIPPTLVTTISDQSRVFGS